MQAREKKLVYILAAVVTGVALWYSVGNPWGSVIAKQKRLSAIETEIDLLNDKEFEIIRASRKMGLWTQQSLPPDEDDAQRLYLAWLTSLAEEIGFEDLKVTPGRKTTNKKDYIAVQIDLEGRTNFERLVRFLHHFEKADLLHRIASLKVDSESSQGDPMLDIKLTAEGIALLRAPARSRLFPSTKLSSAIDSSIKKIEVESSKGFPSAGPFLVRIDDEVFRVTSVKDKTWTVSRGEGDSQATTHVANANIHLGKYNPLLDTTALQNFVAEHREIIRKSPFVLPQVFNPQLQNLGKHIIVQEKPVEIKLQVSDYDPSMGTPTFRFKESPPRGMQIDKKTGKVTWNPTKEDSLGDYSIMVVADQIGSEKPIPEGKLILELRKLNHKPAIAGIEDIEIFPGQSIAFQAIATDKDDAKEPEGKIKFYLKDAPEGASIDEATGQFSWKVDHDFDPGKYDFSVIATDEGKPAETAEESLTVTVLKDAAHDVQLIGVISEEGQKKEAWFYNQSDNKKTTLKKGDSFEWGTIKGSIAEIGRDFVLFQFQNALWKVKLKQTVDAMQKVATTPPKKSASSKKITD